MLKLIPVAAILAFAGPALAQDSATDASLTAIFGSADSFAEAFAAVQDAVANDDADTLSEWVSYPLHASIEGEEMEIADPDSFVANYSYIVTPEIADAVTGQDYGTLFVNQDGVMFGDGQVWMTFICADDACAAGDWKIITIQDAE